VGGGDLMHVGRGATYEIPWRKILQMSGCRQYVGYLEQWEELNMYRNEREGSKETIFVLEVSVGSG